MNIDRYIGQHFGRVTVIGEAREPYYGGDNVRVRCKCDCGTEFETHLKSLKKGLTRSCGCLRQENCIRQGHANHRSVVRLLNSDGSVEVFHSIREAAKATGAFECSISKVCMGRQHTAGGFRFEYV